MSPERWRQVEELYHSVSELDARRRSALLDEACRGDEDLRRQVESLLAQESSPEASLLERPVWEVPANSPVPMAAGTQLGVYRIERVLGEGGMGVVYQARDTRLDRAVALKVSREQFSARFEREARVVAGLNHPNICHLYDIGPNYLVMELVEGEPPEGPLPLETALNYARQIAEALEAAHEKGIVHRDLKPANIKVTPAGLVKVLDFGLAKLDYPPVPEEPATQEGVILGTAGYMSPEQARGTPVDKRADIWAFGVVLYEMLTGRRLFQGETASDTLAAVLTNEPDWDRVPAAARRLLSRCLAKDPRQRLRDIGDAMLLLEDAAPEARSARRPWLAWSVAALTTLFGAFLAVVYFRETRFRQTPAQPRSVRFQIAPPENSAGQEFQLSPDGRYIAFTTLGDRSGIWIRALDSLQSQSLPGTEGAVQPFWSPDSSFVAFFAQGKLKKVAVAGGLPQTICDYADALPTGGAWSRAGTILFSSSAGGVYRVSADGGVPAPIGKPAEKAIHLTQGFLPDGRHFLDAMLDRADISGLYAGSLDGTAPVRILPDLSQTVFVPPTAPGRSGYLLYRLENTLMAQPFDPEGLRITGARFPVAEHLGFVLMGSMGSTFAGAFSASENGVLAYLSGEAQANQQLVWMDRSGKRLGPAGPPGAYGNFRLAPDDKRILFVRRDDQSLGYYLWVLDTTRGVTSRLTFGPASVFLPIWSPDGRRVLFASFLSASLDLYVKAATGAGQEELLVKMGTRTGWGTDWSRDGRFILYQGSGPRTGEDLWIAPQFGDRRPYPYLQSQFNEQEGAFSPDGRWVAYVSDESGRNEIYAQAFPPSGAKFQISTGGGSEPYWRKDGKELFYVAANRNLMAVPVNPGPMLEVGLPKSLMPLPGNSDRQLPVSTDRHSYAVTSDGQRFLVVTQAVGGPAPPITVWLNWNAALGKQ
jgi:serine/threonine protein kinase